MTLAKNGFAIKNSQWNSHWRRKVNGGLTMALSMMTPNNAKKDELNKCGIGSFFGMDFSKMHVAIAVCINGGYATQEEQLCLTTIVYELVKLLAGSGATIQATDDRG